MIRKINNVNVRNFTPLVDFVTHTGSSTNTKLLSVLIPANTFKAGDLINIDAALTKVTTVGNYTYRLYWNTSDSLTGANQLAVRSIGSTNQFATVSRRLSVRTANGGGSAPNAGTELINLSSGIYSEYRSDAVSNASLNWTVDSYIMLAIVLSNSTDFVANWALKVWSY